MSSDQPQGKGLLAVQALSRDIEQPCHVLVSLGGHNEIPQVGGLNNRPWFLTVLEAGNSLSGCLQGRVLVRALFLACRWWPSQCVLTWWRKGKFSAVSFYKSTNPIMGAPSL